MNGTPVSIADIQASPAYFADLPDPALLAHEQDPQIPVLFKSLLKRDAITRERALSDLATAIKASSKPSLELLASWTQIHAKLALDVSPAIRATTHRIHHLLFAAALKPDSSSDLKKYKTTVAKLLRISAGTWAISLHDTDRAAAAEARAALDALFPVAGGKQDAFFGPYAGASILAYAQDILLHQSTESLSDTRFVTLEDARSKRERAVRGAIYAIAALVDRHDFLTGDANDTFLQLVSDSAFWKLVDSSGPIAGRAVLNALPKIIKGIPIDVLVDRQKDIFSAFIKKPLNDSPETSSSFSPTEIMQALLGLTQIYPTIWAYSSDKKKSKDESKLSSKAGVSYLAKYIKKVTEKSAPSPQFWHTFMALLFQIPDPFSPFLQSDSPIALQSSEALLNAVKTAVLTLPLYSPPKAALRGTPADEQSPAAHAWSFYFALVEKVTHSEYFPDQRKQAVKDSLTAFNQALSTVTSASTAVPHTIIPVAQRIANSLFKTWQDVVLEQLKKSVQSSKDASEQVRQSISGYLIGLASQESSDLNSIIVDYATTLLKSNSKALEPLLKQFPDLLASSLQTDLEVLANTFFTTGFAEASADDQVPVIRAALTTAHINVSPSLASSRLVALSHAPTPEFYRAATCIFSFHDSLSSLDSSCAELASAVSTALLAWIQNPASHESLALETISTVVLAHDKISTSAEAHALVDALVSRLIDFEQEQSNPKLCTKIITSLTDLRRADAPFMLDYAQSTQGKATLARLWRLAETDTQSATENSTTIESLIAQLDFFSFVSAPDYAMSSEVLLKVAADLRTEAVAAPGLDLGIVVQRAAGLVEQAPETLALSAFEGLLFPQESWDNDALAPILATGVHAKLRISQTFSGAILQLDEGAISNQLASVADLTKLVNMATFASSLVNTFPELYAKAAPTVQQATTHGVYLADAVLRIYSALTLPSTGLVDVIPAVLKDADQFKNSVESQIDIETLLDVISPKPTKEDLGPLLLVIKSLWTEAAGDDAHAFYAYVVLESFLATTLTREPTIDPTLLKKLVPMTIKNKLGVLALLQALANSSSELVSKSFVVLRNNLVGDLITGPTAQMHEKRGIYNLSLLALALYTPSGNTPNVGVPAFKLTNLITRAATLFDDVYDSEYAPFVIQLGRLLVALASSFPASELPTESFWGPVSEFIGAAITAASANVGSEDEDETYYAHAILGSSFALANAFMSVYSEIESSDIDENMESAYTLFLDTITVFYENEQRNRSLDSLDLEFSQPLLEFVTIQTERQSSRLSKTLAGDAVEASAFYPMFASANPNLQQLGLVVVSMRVRALQKDRALAFATIPRPTPEEIEANLLPIELLSLATLPFGLSSRKTISLDSKDARQYLFAWYIIFQYFDESVFSLCKLFLEQLAESESVLALLGFVAQNLGSLQRGPEKSWDITTFDVHVQISANRSRLLLWHILFQALNHSGFVCKTWFNTRLSHGLKKDAKNVIGTYISPLLIKTEVAGVRKYTEQLKARGDDDEDGVLEGTEISVSRNNKTITLQLLFESEAIEAAFVFPDEYPLQDVRFEGLQRLGVPERQWRAWILFSQTMLLNHTGTIATAIELFKRNVGMYFAGFTECAICYTILQEDKSLPTRECATCHNKFHGLCLSRWFKSGNTDSCPLCRTEHAFK